MSAVDRKKKTPMPEQPPEERRKNFREVPYGYTPEMAAQSLAAGFDFVSVGTDIGFLRAGTAQALATARGSPAPAAPKPIASY